MQCTKLILKTFVAALLLGLLASFGPASAPQRSPRSIGLWQKIDEQTEQPVGWFLFVERDGLYQGAIAKTVSAAGRSEESDLLELPAMTARTSRCSACR